MGKRAVRQDPARLARLSLPEAVTVLLEYGLPMDTFGRSAICAYCGTPAAELREQGHAATCVWAALRDAAQREGVTGG
jgi:hypothetical protein